MIDRKFILLMLNIFFFGLLITYLVSYYHFISTNQDSDSAHDFLATFTAVKLVAAGEGHSLYDLETQVRFQKPLTLLNITRDNMIPYNTPPFYIVLFLPLAFLPYAWAFNVITIFNVSLMFLILNSYSRHFNELKKIGFIVIALACFSFFPCFITLTQGQNSIITLLIISGVYFLLKRERDFEAGAVLALGLYKPQLVMILFFVLLLKRRWRSVIAFSCVAILLIAISYIIVGKEGFGDYISLTLIQSPLVDGKFAIHYTAMHNWRGFFRVILGPNHNSLLGGFTLAASLLSVLILSLAWRGKWEPSEKKFDLKIILTIITTLLVSPHLNIHDLTLWILPGCIILNQIFAQDVYWKKQIVVVGLIAGSLISMLNASLQSTLSLQITTIFMALITILLFVWIRNLNETIIK